MTTIRRTVRIHSAMQERINRSTLLGARHPAYECDLELDADDYAALEQVFRHFNRVSGSDADRLYADGYHLPSLSVDDHVRIDGMSYCVDRVGFQPAPNHFWPAASDDFDGGSGTGDGTV